MMFRIGICITFPVAFSFGIGSIVVVIACDTVTSEISSKISNEKISSGEGGVGIAVLPRC